MACPDCFKGAIHEHGEPQGQIENLFGLPTYVARPTSSSPPSKSSIFFLTDAFGLKLVNNKVLADRYAAETGCKVLIPDIIPGGGMSPNMMNFMDKVLSPVAWTDVMGQLHRIWAGVRVALMFIPFLYKAGPDSVFPSVLQYARAMKKDLPQGGKLGVAGFCWGGYGSTKLCTQTAEEGGSTRLIDAQFNAHPSFLKGPEMVLDAVATLKVPYSMAIGDDDMAFGIKSVHEAEALLRQKVGDPAENNYEIKIYEGCKHGFAIRAAPGSKVETAAAEEAATQAVEWFKKYLN